MQRKRIRKHIVIMVLICILLPQVQGKAVHTISASEYLESAVVVNEIDLGDYQSCMTVGEKQLLNVTILPLEATNQTVTYTSSDVNVANVNGIGRITALKSGVTEITITCGNISEKFGLTVTENQTIVSDIDLGDYPSELEIGSSQLLIITLIPESVSGQKVTYQTSNTDIATVNEIGRITGVKEGTVTITISCGTIKKDFLLKIVETKNSEVSVTAIEIGDYEEEVEVDKTITLSVNVLPADATNGTVTYKSSNEKIATVKSTGEVKGITEGIVTITISAGGITKEINLKVKIATSKIQLDTTYLVLQPGESHQLSASVMPVEADQALTYKTVAPEVVSVTSYGLITANECGTGTIIVKNDDTSTAVTVIVNLVGEDEGKKKKDDSNDINIKYQNNVYVEDYPLISSDMLKYYYENNENLTIYGSGYTLKIYGGEIKNWSNELYTNLELKQEKQGVSFELNQSKNMCGSVLIQFDGKVISGKYVYLYNTSKGKYELLRGQDAKSMKLDTEGKYLVTEKKLSNGRVNVIVCIIVITILMILIGVYIAIKKRYWFW